MVTGYFRGKSVNWYHGISKLGQTDSGNSISQKFSILSSRIPVLVDRIERLNRKANRLGLVPISYTVSDEYSVPQDKDGHRVALFRDIEISGEVPQIGGWRLAARIIHDPAGNILNTVPLGDITIPEIYRTNPPLCEHCCINRPRNDTFLLVNDEGEFKQVGSSCLKDFLGHTDPKVIAKYMEGLGAALNLAGEFANEDIENFDRANLEYNINHILALSNAFIKRFGYMSKRRAEEEASDGTIVINTADKIRSYLNSNTPHKEKIDTSEEDYSVAKDIINYFKSLGDKADTEYLKNLVAIANRDSVGDKLLGYVVSMIPTYQRANEQKMLEQKRSKETEWAGEVGDKYEGSVTLISTKDIDTMYGRSTLYTFRDENGNILKWFSSGYGLDANEGDQIKIRGKIKKLDEYRGQKQTMLTRVKMV